MGIFIGVVISVVLAFLGSYALFALQRKRRVFEYQGLWRGVVIPFETSEGDDLHVQVKRGLVEDCEENRANEYVPAGEVYGFRVLLRNAGEPTIEDQVVTLELDESAKIITIEFEDAPFGFEGETSPRFMGRSNVGVCRIPYLAEREECIVSIQSVGNESLQCDIHARGRNVSVRDARSSLVWYVAALALTALIGAAALFVGVGLGIHRYGPETTVSEMWADKPMGLAILSMQVGSMPFIAGTWVVITALASRRFRWRRYFAET